MDEELIEAVVRDLENRQQVKRINRNLRDVSNPFETPEELFKKLYRLDVQTARDLFDELEPHLNVRQRNTSISKVLRFFSTIKFLAHGCYQKPVAQDRITPCSQPSVSRIVHEVVDAMVNHLGNRYIRFPQTLEEMLTIKQEYFAKHGIPGIIGCIDCTHIKIAPPSLRQLGYPPNIFINRKSFHSINCQLICDVNGKILAADARYPGSVHDAAIWTMSNIKAFLHNNFLQDDEATYLIGDSGYPLLPYLLTPIRGAEPNTPEGFYTRTHQQIRNCVERTNGLLKGVWRCLNQDRVLHYHPQFAAQIVYACAILHNVMRIRNIPVDEVDILIANDDDGNYENDNQINDVQLLHRAQLIRNRIINDFFM